jgi:MazG family protein
VQDKSTLEDTLALMRDLRRRCEWDRAQTHESLRPYLIEEAYEVDDAIQQASAGGDPGALRDELGDLLLQVVFHAVVAEERGAFDLHDVAHALVTKMRARHPHLYPPEGADAPAARPNWEAAKARTRKSIDQGLPAALPALHRAHRLQDRAAGVGFDWPDVEGPADKVAEELAEVRVELARRPGAPPRDTGRAGRRPAPRARRGGAGRPALRVRQPVPQGRRARLARARQGEREVRAPVRRGGAAGGRARRRRRDRGARSAGPPLGRGEGRGGLTSRRGG